MVPFDATAPARTDAAIVPVQAPAASSGFDWGDAGIGAAGALGLLSLGAGGAVAIRRTRGPRHAATS